MCPECLDNVIPINESIQFMRMKCRKCEQKFALFPVIG
jgi:hypothetical protein